MSYGKNAPFGIRPFCSGTGGTWTIKTGVYYISASDDGLNTYGLSIMTGDPVIRNTVAANNGGGTVALYVPDSADQDVDANKTPIVGAFMGCEYTLPSGEVVMSKYWSASTVVQAGTQIKAFICDDPYALYEIQVSTSTNILNNARFTPNLIGQNFGLGVGGGGNNLVPNNPAAGSTRTGQSVYYLDPILGANNDHTSDYLPLKVIGYIPSPQNVPTSYVAANNAPFLNVLVMINNHAYKSGTLGIVAA